MIGRICHIEAALPDGKRFNDAMSNEERRSYDNLLLLCGDHHTVIDDDEGCYSVAQLRLMKQRHEARHSERPGTLQLASGDHSAIWEELEFEHKRDLQPALMGRPLGPADAAACPELVETSLLARDLERAYSARLFGEPGAGKSVCVMQVASHFQKKGWKVFRARNPKVEEFKFDQTQTLALYVVDDAHLTPEHILAAAEQATHSGAMLLCTFNAAQQKGDAAGTTYLDARRAVRTIAKALRTRRDATLEVVRRVDPNIGDKPFEESFDARLDAAERAEIPWQFCFILGGGWTRADAAASSARSVRADLVLAAIAARQILTRDERASRSDITSLLAEMQAPIVAEAIDSALDWLIKNRLVLSHEDLRTPHQRFAAVILKQLLVLACEATDTDALAALVNRLISDDCRTLIGLRNLLQELRLGTRNWRFDGLVKRELLDAIIAECWTQAGEEQRNHACLLLSELQCYYDAWVAAIIRDDGQTLSNWIDEAEGESAYGAGFLLGQLSMKDGSLSGRIASKIDLHKLADKLSAVTPDQVFAMSELVSHVSSPTFATWNERFVARLDKDSLRRLAAKWPDDAYLSSFAKLCAHLSYHDRRFALDLLKIFSARTAQRMTVDPFQTFHEMNDIFWHVLRLHDPLGLYKGREAPTLEMREAGRLLAEVWHDEDLAAAVSKCSLRDFQNAAGFLLFIRKVDQKRFSNIVNRIDWLVIEATLADHLDNLFHDADVFLSICGISTAGKHAIAAMLARHNSELRTLTPRLAYIAFDYAIEFIRSGRVIGISNGHTFAWDWATILMAKFAKNHAELIHAFLAPHLKNAATSLSQKHSSWYDEPLLFLRTVRQFDHVGFEQMFAAIDARTAEVGWANALQSKAKARQTAAFLVQIAINRKDAIGEVARRLREQFQKSSVPSPKLLEPLA
ncbi:hypothetical protein GCM10019060_33000 [Novosphingobium pokkalii]|nr:hypothetical protein GCM10019060_33000 [Novosphingobium pokkalii]